MTMRKQGLLFTTTIQSFKKFSMEKVSMLDSTLIKQCFSSQVVY